MSRNLSQNKIIILDANVWIKGILSIDSTARNIINVSLKGRLKIVVNSYIVAEVIRVLKRIAIRIGVNPLKLERDFWILINSDNVIRDFSLPISENLLEFLRNKDEILLIARALDLEPKDVPYIVLAFKYKSSVITEDKRSIYKKRKELEKRLKIKIFSSNEFLEHLRKH